MNRLLTTLISVIAIGATLPTFAGPDWQLIEHGRKVKLARMQQAAAAAAAAAQTPMPAPASTEPNAAPQEVNAR
jgi:hypothetical protein